MSSDDELIINFDEDDDFFDSIPEENDNETNEPSAEPKESTTETQLTERASPEHQTVNFNKPTTSSNRGRPRKNWQNRKNTHYQQNEYYTVAYDAAQTLTQPFGNQFPNQPVGNQFPNQPVGNQFLNQPVGNQFPNQNQPVQWYNHQQYNPFQPVSTVSSLMQQTSPDVLISEACRQKLMPFYNNSFNPYGNQYGVMARAGNSAPSGPWLPPPEAPQYDPRWNNPAASLPSFDSIPRNGPFDRSNVFDGQPTTRKESSRFTTMRNSLSSGSTDMSISSSSLISPTTFSPPVVSQSKSSAFTKVSPVRLSRFDQMERPISAPRMEMPVLLQTKPSPLSRSVPPVRLNRFDQRKRPLTPYCRPPVDPIVGRVEAKETQKGAVIPPEPENKRRSVFDRLGESDKTDANPTQSSPIEASESVLEDAIVGLLMERLCDSSDQEAKTLAEIAEEKAKGTITPTPSDGDFSEEVEGTPKPTKKPLVSDSLLPVEVESVEAAVATTERASESSDVVPLEEETVEAVAATTSAVEADKPTDTLVLPEDDTVDTTRVCSLEPVESASLVSETNVATKPKQVYETKNVKTLSTNSTSPKPSESARGTETNKKNKIVRVRHSKMDLLTVPQEQLNVSKIKQSTESHSSGYDTVSDAITQPEKQPAKEVTTRRNRIKSKKVVHTQTRAATDPKKFLKIRKQIKKQQTSDTSSSDELPLAARVPAKPIAVRQSHKKKISSKKTEKEKKKHTTVKTIKAIPWLSSSDNVELSPKKTVKILKKIDEVLQASVILKKAEEKQKDQQGSQPADKKKKVAKRRKKESGKKLSTKKDAATSPLRFDESEQSPKRKADETGLETAADFGRKRLRVPQLSDTSESDGNLDDDLALSNDSLKVDRDQSKKPCMDEEMKTSPREEEAPHVQEPEESHTLWHLPCTSDAFNVSDTKFGYSKPFTTKATKLDYTDQCTSTATDLSMSFNCTPKAELAPKFDYAKPFTPKADPAVSGRQKSKLKFKAYVGNLPVRSSVHDLMNLCDKVGEPLGFKRVSDQSAVFTFKNESLLGAFIKENGGKFVFGHKLNVERSQSVICLD